jgi:hypothetical protein
MENKCFSATGISEPPTNRPSEAHGTDEESTSRRNPNPAGAFDVRNTSLRYPFAPIRVFSGFLFTSVPAPFNLVSILFNPVSPLFNSVSAHFTGNPFLFAANNTLFNSVFVRFAARCVRFSPVSAPFMARGVVFGSV